MAEGTYIQDMEEKLKSARLRVKQGREMKALKGSAPTLFEIIDGEISLQLNKMTQDKPLDYDQYLSVHGQIVGIRRIRNVIDSKEVEEVQAAQEVTAIQDNIELVKQNG